MSLLSLGTNKKLGEGIASYSRPVGPSCPQDCPFLPNAQGPVVDMPAKLRCYAEKVQKRYTSVREKWGKESFGLTSKQWALWTETMAREIVKLDKKGARAIRIHVGGDWLQANGALDRTYIACTLLAYRRARARGARIPTWFYTHAWKEIAPHAKFLKRVGIETYASVHRSEDAMEAVKLGFYLAIDPGEEMPETVQPFVNVYGVRSIVCPEMRKKGQVDCTGCMYCPRGKGHVTFYRHR